MPEAPVNFSDARAYERFMGRWSRAVAPPFLQWLAPRPRARWLDVGCGTGVFTEALVNLCDPVSVIGIDNSAAQIAQASRGPAGRRARFLHGDALHLPFTDASFDVAASALVLNFVADPGRALDEMCRVTRPGGMVAGFVWDFVNDLSPSGPLRQALRACGAPAPAIPGTDVSSAPALVDLFARAHLQSIEAKTVDVALAYTDLTDFWNAQTAGNNPTTAIIHAMSDAERRRLKHRLQERLAPGPNGTIEYAARANAIRGTVSQ
jgi:SAM-dependent methyltransferase